MSVLSGCCIAGLGQIVLGQVAKGVVMLGSMVIGALTMGVGILVTWPAGAVDAYMIAKKLKEGRTVGQWEFFWSGGLASRESLRHDELSSACSRWP